MVNRLAGEQAALDAARQIDTRLARLTAEAEGLRRLLAPPPETGEAPPILTALRVAPGFEAAIGAAFGDELLAPLCDAEAPAPPASGSISAATSMARRPARGRPPIGRSGDAPAALARSLAQVGWVESEEAGPQPSAEPGARSAAGGPGRPAMALGRVRVAWLRPLAAAEHLRHGNRLAVLESEIATLKTAAVAAESGAAAARAERQQATEPADRLGRHCPTPRRRWPGRAPRRPRSAGGH